MWRGLLCMFYAHLQLVGGDDAADDAQDEHLGLEAVRGGALDALEQLLTKTLRVVQQLQRPISTIPRAHATMSQPPFSFPCQISA